ncbi:MAG: dTDP-4-dehydrorhamnose reductase [Actinomycetota bacterium]|nr:dTDP-4-dehydrorhamnose reductase [Actinomycetota bacterium]
MRILITGAAGMLGIDVGISAGARGHEVISLARAELDIADAAAVQAQLGDVRPDAVINCAAYTDVDGAESDPASALRVNGDGAGILAAAAYALGAWTIHVSSDYVFDGSKATPYLEFDATGPASAYGRSKLAGERAVAQAAPDAHTIVRSAWLFGAGGPCFPKTILKLAGAREELSVVDDQVGCPTFTGHLAEALISLADGERIAGPVHVAGGGRCTWYEFAREIVGRAGAECEVKPCTTAEFPRPAPRPANSSLITERGESVPRLPHWRAGLEQFIGVGVSR